MRRTALAAALLVLGALPARADWAPSGDLGGFVLIERGGTEDRFGGGLLVDLYQPFGALRIGGSIGLGALTSVNEDANRIFAPLGLVIGVSSEGVFRVGAQLRAGMWSGATNEGLRAGGWVGGGVSLDIRLDDVLRLAAGFEYWFLFGDGVRRETFVPTLMLRWTPAADDA